MVFGSIGIKTLERKTAEVAGNTGKKPKKQPEAEKRASHCPDILWQELKTAIAAVWKEDLEDNLGPVGKTVHFVAWLIIILAAPVAIHLFGWVLFTLWEIVGA